MPANSRDLRMIPGLEPEATAGPDCWRCLYSAAKPLKAGTRVVLDRGPVAKAVRASSAIPGVFNPVELQGRLLVDGGVVDNIPIAVARQKGADVVVAASTRPGGEIERICFAALDRGQCVLSWQGENAGLVAAGAVPLDESQLGELRGFLAET